MRFKSEFFNHIAHGLAGDADVVLARLALHVGGQSLGYPSSFDQLSLLSDYGRKEGTQGLNEFFVLECVRAILVGEITPWVDADRVILEKIASKPTPATLSKK